MINKFSQTDKNTHEAAAHDNGGFFAGARDGMAKDGASCRSLYIHVPFCERKCNYCAFESAPPREGDFELWLSSLKKELAMRRAVLGKLYLDTCYVGGGTPTVLPPQMHASAVIGACRSVGNPGYGDVSMSLGEKRAPLFMYILSSIA